MEVLLVLKKLSIVNCMKGGIEGVLVFIFIYRGMNLAFKSLLLVYYCSKDFEYLVGGFLDILYIVWKYLLSYNLWLLLYNKYMIKESYLI